MRKAAISLTVQSLFAVFIVIFVLFIALSALRSRTTNLESTQYFDYYTISDNFLLEFLSNPACLTLGDYSNVTTQIPVQGLLDYVKINRTYGRNADLACAENFYFLYTIHLYDQLNKKEWTIGLDDRDYQWVDRRIQTSLPVAILYDRNHVHVGEAALVAYTGDIPYFYAQIKKACNTQSRQTVSLKTQHSISYYSADNRFCVDKDCFSPYFSCKVTTFNIPPSDKLINIIADSGTARVIV